MHFIGASPYGADWAAMLRRILGKLKRRFGIEQEIPDQPDDLRAAFGNWLHMAAARCAESPSRGCGKGELDGAMRFHQEEERICREVGYVQGIAISLANQAVLLASRNRPQQALPLVEHAYRLARDHGYAAPAEQIKSIIGAIRRVLR